MEKKPFLEGFSNVQKAVDEWFAKLQKERKCSSTNTISKLVNNSPLDVQEGVRKMISAKITRMANECIDSQDSADMLIACKTINGCFDNFTHAADAIQYSFPVVQSFITCVIDKCQVECKNMKTAMSVQDLLHSLSRILILILKLKRFDSINDSTKNLYRDKLRLSPEEKAKLKLWTSKLQFFLLRDDILIDTKNNLAICSILIREIIYENVESMKMYQKQVLATIPDKLDTKDNHLHQLQFLITSAIINTWSTTIIEKEATFEYLKFLIDLCESYSSETPIILNASRTLLLLIKNKCFYEFVSECDSKRVLQIIDSLLSCVYMLLEHPVPCVRHSAKEYLLLLMSYPVLQEYVLDSTFKLPRDRRSYFISLAAIASEMGARVLIEKDKDLPNQLLNSLYDPTMVSHVSFAIENMILKDSWTETNFSGWCELWIIPLLILLTKVPAIVAADIDKLLEKAFKKYPNAMLYITDKWKTPASGEEIRYIITALKISHKHGFKFKPSTGNDNKKLNKESEAKWKMLVSEELLEHCLHQGDDEIRISAFSLLVEARKSTEVYSEEDFRLILYFLKYNLNNHQPATRQKIISLMRKMLVRYSDSRAVLLRQTKSKLEEEKHSVIYDSFLNSLVEFCFSNIFAGCNFNRLNTVLNILLICFESINEMSFDVNRTDYYWTKFLVALDSSYEENKELVVALMKKLNHLHLAEAGLDVTKKLFEKSFCLITHMEPPDVLTGSYLLQILINLPTSKEILSNYFGMKNEEDNDAHFLVIKFLTEKLRNQVLLAKFDLMTAATCGPMYGTLSAIRLIFRDVDFSSLIKEGVTHSSLSKWSKVLNELVDVCFDIIPSVACVVNSSSPEGHLPMDFQTNFENLKIDLNTESAKHQNALFVSIFTNFIKDFTKIESSLKIGGFDVYESVRSLICLSKIGYLLNSKIKSTENNDASGEIEVTLKKINDLVEKLSQDKKAVDWPATAQVLLLCAWRSIKEVSLYLGDFVSKLPVDTGIDVGYLVESKLVRIGEELKVSLCEIKHRGSFEHVYFGFTQFVNSLWKSSRPSLNTLPRQWLEEIASQLEMPVENQTLKLCSTRRSAGLPFLVQAVICSEIVSVKSSTPSSLHTIMKSLLNITEKGVPNNMDSKIHALNILRALFKHAQLGEHVSSYISKALMVAIRGSRGSTWSERNSSNLLFSSLVIRIFGVDRSKDEISKKNRMTSRTFFQRYSELYEFLLSEMKLAQSTDDSNSLYPKPSLYLILLVLGRLYPTPREDAEILHLSEFLPFINLSRRSPIMKIRELAARALVPLIPHDCLLGEIDDRFNALEKKNHLCQNEIHGILLQIKALLQESVDIMENSTENLFDQLEADWIQNTKWILTSSQSAEKASCVVMSSYLNVLHILFKSVSKWRSQIADIILNNALFDDMLSFSNEKRKTALGIHLCLEVFSYLKLDVLAERCFRMDDLKNEKEIFLNFLLSMLSCEIEEIRWIPLKIFCLVLNDESETIFDEDDFSRIESSRKDLFIYREKENVQKLRNWFLETSRISQFLFETLRNGSGELFKSKVTLRLWLKALSRFLLNDGLSTILADAKFKKELMESTEFFLNSNDKEISSSALLINSVCLIRQISENKKEKEIEKLSNLLENFSSTSADTKEKLSVAKAMNHCFDDLIDKKLIQVTDSWMIPVKLLLDECTTVRHVASNFVYKFHSYLANKSQKTNLPIPMKILNWPVCNLVSLKAQESLLDSYLNITDDKSRLNLFVHMLAVALSSSLVMGENSEPSKDEFGVFEKGNPNPYYEEVAVTNLISDRLRCWKNTVNIHEILNTVPDESLWKFMEKNFNVSPEPNAKIIEIISKIGRGEKNVEEKNEEFSVVLMQNKTLMRNLNLFRVQKSQP